MSEVTTRIVVRPGKFFPLIIALSGHYYDVIMVPIEGVVITGFLPVY